MNLDGKTEKGKWVYGHLYYSRNDMFNIVPFINCIDFDFTDNISDEEVIPETIGQFTGICDKYKAPVFEGDIVELDMEGRILFGTKEHPCRRFQCVGFHEGAFMTGRSRLDPHHYDTYLWILKDNITVVGNIYDDPKILEREEN